MDNHVHALIKKKLQKNVEAESLTEKTFFLTLIIYLLLIISLHTVYL